MAITKYLQPNALKNRLALEYQVASVALQAQREKNQKTILYWGVLPCILCPPLLPAPLALYFLAGKSGSISLDPVQLAGCTGEHKTLDMLKHLDDRYTILNQVKLPYDKSGTGYREADFVVHGPNGIFVVESKEYSGDLGGTEWGDTWVSTKEGRDGTNYTKGVTNPVRQVKHYSKLLSDILKARGADSWVEGVVSLTRNNNIDGVDTTSVAILPATRLTDYIERFVKRRPHLDSLSILLDLVQAEKKEAIPDTLEIPPQKETIMSKDDLLFKNIMKFFAIIAVIGIAIPVLFILAPNLVKSVLMLGVIGGIGYGVLAFLANNRSSASITAPSNNSNQFLNDLSYTGRSAGKNYGSESFGMCPEDD